MQRTHVSSLLTTATNNYQLVSTTVRPVVVGTAPIKSIETAFPIGATGSLYFTPTASNLLKVYPFLSSATAALTMRVIGWSKATASNSSGSLETIIVPTLLSSTTVAFGGTLNNINIPGGSPLSLFPATTFTTLYGPAVNYPGLASQHNGFLVVDALGSQYIEINITHASTAANYAVLVGGI